jgi:hypothetical protein
MEELSEELRGWDLDPLADDLVSFTNRSPVQQISGFRAIEMGTLGS